MKLPDSFWSKARRTDCILWMGAVNSRGYGCFAVNGVSQLAHRLSYEEANGPIPEGLVIDHLCRTHNCVNPEHLEAVTNRENNRRGQAVLTECQRGHDWTDPAMVYTRGDGRRECVECRRLTQVKRRGDKRVVEVDSPAAVRAWAQENGYLVGVRGRIPANIRAAYVAAREEAVAS